MRVVVIGAGGAIGQRHLRLVHELGHDAVPCDANPALLAEVQDRHDLAEAYTDYRDALARPADAAIVCTPNHLHAPVALAALARGCHVLMEKPIAHTLADARAIVDAAQAAGRVLLVGYTLRQWPGLDTVQAWLRDGSIGPVLSARAVLGASQPLAVARSDYRQRREMGGGVILDFTHELDYLRLLVGEVARVACLTRVLDHLPLQTEGLAAMLLHFANGAIGELHLDYVQPGVRRLELIGPYGLLTYDFGVPAQRVDTVATRLERRLWSDAAAEVQTWEIGRDGPYLQQWQVFADLIAGDAAPRARYADGPDAVKTLALALAALQSADEARFIVPASA